MMLVHVDFSGPRTVPRGDARPTSAPGFQRVRIGDLLVTALYDGFAAIPAQDLCGATPAEVGRLYTEAFLPADGDLRTAVIAFLVQTDCQRILIDAGAGCLLGPDTGQVAANLAASGTDPVEVDHVLLTHLHPDHAGGLTTSDGQAVFKRAIVHAARADAAHYLDPTHAAAAPGTQSQIHDMAARALAPYRADGRFVTFGAGEEVIPGVRSIELPGHTPGHTGYLLGTGDKTVLFGGDTVHSHAVQLRRPDIAIAYDSDRVAAVDSRRRAFDLVAGNRWWIAAAHLPFPGLGHLRRDSHGYSWVPVTFTPVV